MRVGLQTVKCSAEKIEANWSGHVAQRDFSGQTLALPWVFGLWKSSGLGLGSCFSFIRISLVDIKYTARIDMLEISTLDFQPETK